MPLFFIDISSGEHAIIDTDGEYFSSEDEAIQLAMAAFIHFVAALVELTEPRCYRMLVRDEAGASVFETCLTARAEPRH